MSEFRIQFGEKTQFGHIILPHQYQGAGPLYYAVLIKKQLNLIKTLINSAFSGNLNGVILADIMAKRKT